uniref:Uncharacterized protein n=1 Tax=Arundo donax TaxID=35708 RepID=A0A0A9FI53_ARUDO
MMSVRDGVIFRGGGLAFRRISGGIYLRVRLVVHGGVGGAVRLLGYRSRILLYRILVVLLLRLRLGGEVVDGLVDHRGRGLLLGVAARAGAGCGRGRGSGACVRDAAELGSDVRDGVELLHVEDGEPVEAAAVERGEHGLVLGAAPDLRQVPAQCVDHRVCRRELPAKPPDHRVPRRHLRRSRAPRRRRRGAHR